MTPMRRLKQLIGCYNGWVGTCGRTYDLNTVTGLVRWRTRGAIDRLKRWPIDLRCKLADRLSYFAVRLRGHKWYIADSYHGLPGNRASELNQQIWTQLVCLFPAGEYDSIEEIGPKLTELAQLAGENWGHFPRPTVTFPKT